MSWAPPPSAPAEVTAIILDSAAISNLTQHLKVVFCALLKALGLKQLVLAAQVLQTLSELTLYRV